MKKIVLINGSSCSGKSTLIKVIIKENKGLYHLSFDRIKWGFSDYKENRDHYIPIIDTLFLEDACTIFSFGYTIVTDSVLRKHEREKLIHIAEEYWYKVTELNIEAEYSILKQRFFDRVERAKLDPTMKISNTSLDRWQELYDIYQKEKNPKATIYQSDNLSPEQIYQVASEYIWQL